MRLLGALALVGFFLAVLFALEVCTLVAATLVGVVRRGRAALRSKLDVVPGLGPVRRRALLRHFGSIDAIREAPLEQLTTVVPRPVALRVKELL